MVNLKTNFVGASPPYYELTQINVYFFYPFPYISSAFSGYKITFSLGKFAGALPPVTPPITNIK